MRKPSVLMAWIGVADFRASEGLLPPGMLGPIGQALKERFFTHAFLLSSGKADDAKRYKIWLSQRTSPRTRIEIYPQVLESPTDFEEIYKAARGTLEKLSTDFHTKGSASYSLTFHLSPGTPIMAAVWIFLAKTSHSAELIESSVPERGVQTVSFPFRISVDFLPDFVQEYEKPDAISEAPGFAKIIGKCDLMQILAKDANNVSQYDRTTVLILGESGTGKELFARAIHENSSRNGKPFIAVNCGAIPKGLLESELFGYEKGAFTDAAKAGRKGIFEQAHGGTLFLDEIGEMAPDLQVKLLRAIQEREITKIGGEKPTPIDVRLITATNKDIGREVSENRFRQDLFYRITEGSILRLPPLRDRGDDLPLLINYFLQKTNEDYKKNKVKGPGWRRKTLSSSLIDILCKHDWPGNIRELESTIKRAATSAQDEKGSTIREKDIEQAMLFKIRRDKDDADILNRRLGEGFSLEDLLNEVTSHYVKRALHVADGKKTKAAVLLGFKSHQAFDYVKNKLKI